MDTIDQQIGQMLLLGFRGFEVGEDDPIARDIRELNLGGVIHFDYDVTLKKAERNIRSPEQVRRLNDSLQRMSEVPLLVSVDQEGGKVSRLKEEFGFPPTLSAQALGERDDPAETRRWAEQCAATLKSVGFNLNFAPDVDLRINPENPIIGGKERSYSADPAVVVRHAREVMQAHQERGVACTIKHFPGHGSSLADTHLGFVDVTETWVEKELEPFRQLIASGDCWSVMTAHIFNAKLDPELPATLSRRIIGGILREQYQFDGVVFSDDMEMGAISSRYGLETALYHAIDAGVDIVTFANNVIYQPDVGRKALGIIKRFVQEGKISEERIAQSCRRILAMKKKLGLIA
jgi:beta-N-acetylhexosaminidase